MNPLRILLVGLLLYLTNFTGRWWALLLHVAGAVLVMEASRRLADESPRFATLRWLVLAQIAATTGMLAATTYQSETTPDSALISLALMVFVVVGIIIHLSVVYLVCRGIADCAQRAWLPDLEHAAMRRWRFYRGAFILIFVWGFTAIATARAFRYASIVYVVPLAAAVAAWLAVLALVWRAGTELKQRLALRL